MCKPASLASATVAIRVKHVTTVSHWHKNHYISCAASSGVVGCNFPT